MPDLFEEFMNSGDSDSGDEGRANSDDGRQMGVAPAEPQQGMDALVAVLSSIALLGLPAKGAVTTAAVGSKL